MAQRGYRTIKLELPRSKGIADVYTSARVADALTEITADATLYDGVRMVQVMEAVYLQGRKDGAREAFDRIDRSLTVVKDEVPHRRPGRPQRPPVGGPLVGRQLVGRRRVGNSWLNMPRPAPGIPNQRQVDRYCYRWAFPRWPSAGKAWSSVQNGDGVIGLVKLPHFNVIGNEMWVGSEVVLSKRAAVASASSRGGRRRSPKLRRCDRKVEHSLVPDGQFGAGDVLPSGPSM